MTLNGKKNCSCSAIHQRLVPWAYADLGCDVKYLHDICRVCHCAREWHPLDGRCRVGPETDFSTVNCYCLGYIPLDNLEYLEWKYKNKSEEKK